MNGDSQNNLARVQFGECTIWQFTRASVFYALALEDNLTGDQQKLPFTQRAERSSLL